MGTVAGERHVVIGKRLLVISFFLMQFTQGRAGLWMGGVLGDRIEQVFFRRFGIAHLAMKLCQGDVRGDQLRATLFPTLEQSKCLIISILLDKQYGQSSMTFHVLRIDIETLVVISLRLGSIGLVTGLPRKMMIISAKIIVAIRIIRIDCHGFFKFL